MDYLVLVWLHPTAASSVIVLSPLSSIIISVPPPPRLRHRAPVPSGLGRGDLRAATGRTREQGSDRSRVSLRQRWVKRELFSVCLVVANVLVAAKGAPHLRRRPRARLKIGFGAFGNSIGHQDLFSGMDIRLEN
jgi:hypothetical protein